DLKRIALIGGAWDARHVALDFRVACQPVCPVFVSFGQRFRPVRNLPALNDTHSRGHAERGTQRRHRSLTRGVVLDIPIRGIEGLPDSAQIGFTVSGTRRPVRRTGLTERWYFTQPQDESAAGDHRTPKPV